MAEKKFFVDINLQGSALTNATIGTNSSLTKAGSFGFDGTRLQYFNGTAIEEVANLADVAAVTGGLIFQGGYDPTTDTPDITDGTAYKGFFWAATAAGTFLGESVQVGDSIIAKVDNAGATIADWLILQGNIVIATDSVDGISRLATQTEANDGTEGGAVVITPATLQGKIDAQITPEISNKLPLAGGTMSGSVDMGGNSINNIDVVQTNELVSTDGPTGVIMVTGTIGMEGGDIGMGDGKIFNLAAPTDGGDAANKTYVDDQDALKLSLTGGTMSGNIEMGGNNINGVSSFNANDINTDYLVAKTQSVIRLSNNLDADSTTTIVNLPAPLNTGDATNKTYVDTAASTAQANAEATASADATAKADAAEAAANAYTDTGLAAKLSLAGGTMSGNLNMGNNNLGTVNDLEANQTFTNAVRSLSGGPINVEGLNFQSFYKATGLIDPTDAGDAANKNYVDTTAATAEANANDYTDTEIAAQKYHIIIPNTEGVGGWTFGSGVYAFTIQHNLNSEFILASFQMNGWSVEFDWGKGSANTAYVVSNSLPPSEIYASIVKA